MKKIIIFLFLLSVMSFSKEEITYYPNGSKKLVKNFNETGSGNYTLFDEKGNILEKGSYKNGELDGVFSFYNKGRLKGTTTYKHNLKNGKYVNYDKYGRKKEEGVYLNDKENGKIITYYENGKINYQIEYSNGIRNGKTIGYYENGQVKEVMNFSNGHPVGENIMYYPSGEVHWKSNVTGTIIFNKDGSFDLLKNIRKKTIKGEATEYYKDGNVKKVHKLK